MRFRTFSLGIRHQLWGLFGLFLLAGATVLVIDEMLQYRARTSLEQMQRQLAAAPARVKAVSDGYGLDVVDTTFRVRNDLMTWDKGVATIDAARKKIDRQLGRPGSRCRAARQQQALFEQVAQARVRSRAAMETPARDPACGAT